jgi:uncharacterized protein (DUF433 family)
MSMTHKRAKEDPRYEPLYSIVEVSRYARVQPTTLRFWTRSQGGSVLVPAGHKTITPLSFINLIESHVLVALRRTHKVPMQSVGRALEWLRRRYEVTHPLAELDLETDGLDVFINESGHPVSASRGGQMGIREMLSHYLKRIERDPNKVPIRFYPLPNDNSPMTVVMDPSVAYGRPVIEGTRITTQMVFERYSGGESLMDIADDYDLKMPVVEEALRCEIEDHRAAA